MQRSFILKGAGIFAGLVAALAAQPNVEVLAREVAGMRNDVQLLQHRVGELEGTIIGLRRENEQLQARANQNYATVAQLNEAIAEMNRSLQSGLSGQKRDILQQVASQMERLGKETQRALDAVARGQATRPAVTTDFKEDFPKQGVHYTVQAGDTLSGIAQKLNARVPDIVNANKIADPTKLRVGDTLFIPQR
ncbi:MAG TPA: LysM peptidoglycan-binding domain-containing protein [Opitutaceae bacterium]|nr:LysM peptidoglycan-binding domain-containing protein [Opitutaceae bacterium]